MVAEIVVKTDGYIIRRGRYARVQKSHNKYTIECYSEDMINDMGDDRHKTDVYINDEKIDYDSIDVLTNGMYWDIVVYIK